MSAKNTQDSNPSLLGTFVGSLFSTIFVNPFARSLNIVQTQAVTQQNEKLRLVGIFETLQQMPRSQGFTALWRGGLTNTFYNTIFVPISTSVAGKVQKKVQNSNMSLSTKLLVNEIAPEIAGHAVASLVAFPVEHAWTKYSADLNDKYGGVLQVFSTTVNEQGVLGLYNGLAASVLANVVYRSIYYVGYRILKKLLPQDNFKNRLVLGQTTSVLATAASYPLQTAMRQAIVTDKSAFAILSDKFQSGQFADLYVGSTTAFAITFFTGLGRVVYDYFTGGLVVLNDVAQELNNKNSNTNQ